MVHATTVAIVRLLAGLLVSIKLVGLLNLLLNALKGLRNCILKLQVEVLVVVNRQMAHMVLLYKS